MALEVYRRKRDFSRTAEPEGADVRPQGGDSYLIQKHAARRLHYDLRLELDGVLLSWAVTKGPSLVPGEKRLAVHVEDHPLEYGEFEGTIPKGEYGGGSVILWDRGHWRPRGDPRKGLAKGHLDFEVFGEKLKGHWHLVRLRGKPREKTENWLLIKSDDKAARDEDDPDILEERPESVKTGRRVEELAGEPPGWSSRTGKIVSEPAAARVDVPTIKGAVKAALPDFVEPMLATLAGKPPKGKQWVHEIKFDGYRLQANVRNGKVRLLTRSGLDWTGRFGKAITGAFAKLPVKQAIIDGELVVENDIGASDFPQLQAELSAGRSKRFVYYAFDLLFLDGHDLRRVPLKARKQALGTIIAEPGGVLRLSEHFNADAEVVLRHACRLSLEGVVSKRLDGEYRSGRTKDWIKSKCSERQEFVIAGYVPSTTSGNAIGSLVLGYFDGEGNLVHAGRVGTGFTVAVAEDLHRRLEPLRATTSPFARRLTADQARQVRHVKPELVAEVEFRGWTADKSLRHASFRGLREDKPAREIIMETAITPTETRVSTSIKLTHPDRIYWPDAGVTKAGLADYYADVWTRIAPFITGRPLSLVRCPGGTEGQCFFQKHAWKGLSRSIRQVLDPKDKDQEQVLGIDDFDGLVALVQAGVLEIHPWGSSFAALEQPDMIIMDLDPGPGVEWEAVMAAAREVRGRLEALNLAAFLKTSGGKGLHVVSPLRPEADWATVKHFTKVFADSMAADSPGQYVSTITKSKRTGKILIDYLRNGRGATAVAPYSTRARPLAPVSMPIAWDELSEEIGPAYFTVANAPTRLFNQRSDPWGDFRGSAVPLPPSPRR